MDYFNKLTITHFIWYLVPGLGFIFFLLFPFLVINPHLAKQLFVNAGPFGLLFLAVILGFGLDGLRLYRFRDGYDALKKNFFSDLINKIGIELDPYFIQSRITDIARKKNITGLSHHHAIWIMHGHLAILAFIEAFFWILAIIYLIAWAESPYSIMGIETPKGAAITIYCVFYVIFMAIGFRFQSISVEDQQTTNKMFMNFTEQHLNEILDSINANNGDSDDG